MKVIIWTKPDGSVSFTYPLEALQAGETEAQYLDRIAAKVKANGAVPADWIRMANMDTIDLPQDRQFRDAWAWSGLTMIHDIAKAKTIHQARLDAKNDEKLRKLHLETVKAEGNPAKLAQANADLQAARAGANALQGQIQASQTIAALKAILPL